MAAILGTKWNDYLVGARGDTLYGGAGDDTLAGGGGITLIGGNGDDVYFATSGDAIGEALGGGTDTLYLNMHVGFERGPDFNERFIFAANEYQLENVIFTGTGDIFLYGGDGVNNLLVANAGKDVLSGGSGADTMKGRGGDDRYVVHDTDDVVIERVGDGHDSVYTRKSFTLGRNVEDLIADSMGNGGLRLGGNGLDNHVAGGIFDDTLRGGRGVDTMHGGDGNDWYYIDERAELLIDNGETDQGGMDRLVIDLGDSDALTIDFSQGVLSNVEHLVFNGTGRLDATGHALYASSLTGGSAADRLAGGNNEWAPTGDTLIGRGGADTLLGMGDGDLLSGGVGGDLLDGGDGDDTLGGDIGADTLVAGAGHDMLDAGQGGDRLDGGDGDDLLQGGGGTDAMSGGAGDDTYFLDQVEELALLGGERADDGGRDRLVLDFDTAAPLLIDLGNGALAAWEDVEIAGSGAFDVVGNERDNVVSGTDSANRIAGGGGADRLDAGGGDDTLAGDDGNDYLIAGSGSDLLEGGAGDDHLDGGTGVDTLVGGAGRDSYLVDNARELALIAGEDAGSSDIDYLSLRLDGGSRLTVDLTSGPLAGIENVSLYGDRAIDLLGNEANNSLQGGSGHDLILGGGGKDHLFGGDGDDTLAAGTAGDGFDIVNGEGGDDSLVGSDGADVLDGGLGRDTLYGGAGADMLTGGADSDVFVFDTAPVAGEADMFFGGGFQGGVDQLWLDNDAYSGLGDAGALAAGAFRSGDGLESAQDADDRLILDTSSGFLYYDADGAGGQESVLIARWARTLAAADVSVIE